MNPDKTKDIGNNIPEEEKQYIETREITKANDGLRPAHQPKFPVYHKNKKNIKRSTIREGQDLATTDAKRIKKPKLPKKRVLRKSPKRR